VSNAVLALCAGLSLNILLQWGVGIEQYEHEAELRPESLLFQGAAQFFTALLLWCLFSYVFSPLSAGFFQNFLILPLIFAVKKGLEYLSRHFFSGASPGNGPLALSNACMGLSFFSLTLTLRLAASFLQALVLALAFSLGSMLALLILSAIGRRSALEQAPAFLRGAPLTLIAMGLLSLIFTVLGALFLRIPA
jgi:electron transport complex protein RnfA